jgi:short-subunit dehydrogenase
MPAVVVFGATSAIAQAAARKLASGSRMHLVARDAAKLAAVAQDLTARGASVTTAEVDLGDLAACAAAVDGAVAALGTIDVALLAHGIMTPQADAERSYAATEPMLRVNFLSYVAILTPLANAMETARSGVIAVISSVAGDRGRQSNYVYGTSKAAVSAFTQGLRNRLCKSGVHVLTIKPGFVSTPMTAGIDQGPLFASAEVVGDGIHRAILKKRNVAYLPWFWLGIMAIIKAIPEAVFKKLRL